MIFCRFCGKKIQKDSMFCSYCGKKLVNEGQGQSLDVFDKFDAPTESDPETISEFKSDPEFVWNLHEFPKPKKTDDIVLEWQEALKATRTTGDDDTFESFSASEPKKEIKPKENARLTEELSDDAFKFTKSFTLAEKFKSIDDLAAMEELATTKDLKSFEDLEPLEELKPKRRLRLTEELKAINDLRLTDELKAINDLRATEESKPAENLKSTGESKVAENLRAAEESKAAENLKPLENLKSIKDFLNEKTSEKVETPGVSKIIPPIMPSLESEAEKEKTKPLESEAEKEKAKPLELEAEKEKTKPLESEAEADKAKPLESKPEKETAKPLTFEDIKKELEMVDAELSYAERIDKFYTFDQKNEEFQKLLDKEYERTRNKEKELSAGIEDEAKTAFDEKLGKLNEAKIALDEKLDVRSDEDSEDELDEDTKNLIEKLLRDTLKYESVEAKNAKSDDESADKTDEKLGESENMRFAGEADSKPDELDDELDDESENMKSAGEADSEPDELDDEPDEADDSEPAEKSDELDDELAGKPDKADDDEPDDESTGSKENLIFDNDTLSKRFDTKEFNADLIEAALVKAGVRIARGEDGFFELLKAEQEKAESEKDDSEENKDSKEKDGQDEDPEEAGETTRPYESGFKPKFITDLEEEQEEEQQLNESKVADGISLGKFKSILSKKFPPSDDVPPGEDSESGDDSDELTATDDDDVPPPDVKKQQAFKELEQLWDSEKESKSQKDSFTADDEKEPKKGTVSTIVIIALAAILTLQVTALGIIHAAPESGAARFINNELGFVVTWFHNIRGGGDRNVNESYNYENSGREEVDLIGGQLHHNANIEYIEPNMSLGFIANREYEDARIDASMPIENNLWRTYNGQRIYYDEEAVATIIKFNSKWVDYINYGEPDVLALVHVASPMEQALLRIDRVNEPRRNFVRLQIGEIRRFSDTFFVWTRVEIEKIGSPDDVVRENRIYELVTRNTEMFVIQYFLD